jgi:uncharacterized protein (TIGR00369 family)
MANSEQAPRQSGADARYGWLYGRGEPPPYLSILGCRVESVGKGECVVNWMPPTNLRNTGGAVQGGFVAAALDLASAIAASTCDVGTGTASVRLDTEYFRPVLVDGSRVYSLRGKVANRSRHWVTSDAEVFNADNKLCARARHLIAVVEPVSPKAAT